jgi:hypothetical protein
MEGSHGGREGLGEQERQHRSGLAALPGERRAGPKIGRQFFDGQGVFPAGPDLEFGLGREH